MEDEEFDLRLGGMIVSLLCDDTETRMCDTKFLRELLDRYDARADDARRWRTLMGHPCVTGECDHRGPDYDDLCWSDEAVEVLIRDPRATQEDLAYLTEHEGRHVVPSIAPLRIRFHVGHAGHGTFHGETLAEVVASARAWLEEKS